MSSEKTEKESTNSASDDGTHVTGSMAKGEAAKQEGEVSKVELVDLLGVEVVNKYYNDKLQKDGTSEVIPNFKASDMHLSEWRKVVKACPNRIGKGWRTIYVQIQTRMDYLHTTKAELGINLDIPLNLKDISNTMMYIVQEIFFRCHQGFGLDDHARTFSSLLLAKVDKRNLNPLKHLRVIEQPRQ
ncbi:hypothetical protein Tco_0096380, partial [Tanacetum coccineum]